MLLGIIDIYLNIDLELDLEPNKIILELDFNLIVVLKELVYDN